jgi:hypothetical protein
MRATTAGHDTSAATAAPFRPPLAGRPERSAASPTGWGGALLVAAILASPAAARGAPRSPWAGVAHADLDRVHEALVRDHPGAVDAENPGFARWLQEGFAEAKRSADAARSLDDAQAALRRFLAGFGDGHLGVDYDYGALAARWAGIIPARRGDRTVIAGVAEDWPSPLPAVGDELVGCDGRRPDDIVRADILPWVDRRPALDSVLAIHTQDLLVDDPLVRRKLPSSCVVRGRGGERTIPLTWRRDSEQVIRRAAADAGWGRPPPTRIERLGRDRYWITFSISFPPKKEEEAAIRSVIETLPRLRGADLIVFDVRGNNGGNSEWGDRMAKALFTPAYLARLKEERAAAPAIAQFRVSAANLRHLEETSQQLRSRFPETSPIVRSFDATREAMRAALAKGEVFVTQQGAGQDERRDDPQAAAPTGPPKGTVVLLTSGRCASACLDFADRVLAVPGVLHVGQETSADTVYMEIRTERLPSGLGTLYLPTKVYRNRRRGHNEPYRPSLVYPGAIGDDGAVKRWVLEVVAKRRAR